MKGRTDRCRPVTLRALVAVVYGACAAARADDSITIQGGAVVVADTAYLGKEVTNRYSRALVTDPGSTWQASSHFIGHKGGETVLTVTNGGRMLTDHSVEVGSWGTADSNRLLVAGAGSVMSNSGLTLGLRGMANRLDVRDGASFISGAVPVGDQAESSSNTVIVSGSGTTWRSSSIDIGRNGPGCSMTVSDGAVVGFHRVWLGVHPSSSSNKLIVTGRGTLLTNYNDHIDEDVDIGRQGGPCEFYLLDGAQMYVESSTVIGHWVNGHSTIAVMSGSNTACRSGIVQVGDFTSSNRLSVLDGAVVDVGRWLIVGNSDSATSNLLEVVGDGTRLSSMGATIIGGGPGNRMEVRDGAHVAVSTLTIGLGHSGSSNTVLVAGPSTIWTNTGWTYIGHDRAGNALIISNGAAVYGVHTEIGEPGMGSGIVRVSAGKFHCIDTNDRSRVSVDVRHGLFEFDEGSTVVGNLSVGPSGRLIAAGELGGRLQSAGRVDVGTGVAALRVASNLTLAATAETFMEIGGVGDGDHDRVLVMGDFTAAGSLHLHYGYVPETNDVVALFWCAGARSGSFDISCSGKALAAQGWFEGSNYVVACTVVDRDEDMLPDSWEVGYFGNPTGAVAAADSDADGLDNFGEYTAGTSPTDPGSVLRLARVAPSAKGSAAELSWASATGVLYSVNVRTSMMYGAWGPVLENISASPPTNTASVGFPDGRVLFYRIEAERQE